MSALERREEVFGGARDGMGPDELDRDITSETDMTWDMNTDDDNEACMHDLV